MFKEQIVEGLRAKSEIKRFGLSNEAIDRIASAREKTVTEESQVEAALTDAETMRLVAEELMKHRDQEISKRTSAQSAFEAYKQSHPEKTPPADEGGKDDPNKDLLDKIAAITKRLDDRDAKDKKAATIASVVASAKASGCTYEKALKLTEKLFNVKDDESDEDAAKRFKEEYDSNIKEFFGDGGAPYRGNVISEPAKVSAEDRAAKARDDAKRVRES